MTYACPDLMWQRLDVPDLPSLGGSCKSVVVPRWCDSDAGISLGGWNTHLHGAVVREVDYHMVSAWLACILLALHFLLETLDSPPHLAEHLGVDGVGRSSISRGQLTR